VLSAYSIRDPEASHFDDFGDRIQTLQNVEPLLTFGNSRLAFVLLAEIGQGEKAFGMAHSAVILRKLGKSFAESSASSISKRRPLVKVVGRQSS
jgi:hypothetical protein